MFKLSIGSIISSMGPEAAVVEQHTEIALWLKEPIGENSKPE